MALLKENGFQGYPCLLVFLAQMPQQRTLEQSGDSEGSLWSCLLSFLVRECDSRPYGLFMDTFYVDFSKLLLRFVKFDTWISLI